MTAVGQAVRVLPVARRRARRVVATHRWVLVGVVVGALVVWEVVSRLGLVNPMFISRPSAIVAVLPEMAGDERTRDALRVTGLSILWSVFYAVLIGILVGYLLGTVRLLRDAFYGPLLFLMSVPKSIFIPIFLVVFGINTQAAIYYGAYSGVIYVIINVIGGLDLVEDSHLLVARAYAASVPHRVRDIVLPASMPGVFTGIWYGIKNGLQGVLIFELFISVGGLGALIKTLSNNLEIDRVFAIVLGVAIAAIVLGEVWSAVERRLSRWRPSSTSLADTRV